MSKLIIDLEDFRKDKSEGSWYHSYQANIAMAFKDEFWRKCPTHEHLDLMDENTIHDIANQAAKNFLDLLIYEPRG